MIAIWSIWVHPGAISVKYNYSASYVIGYLLYGFPKIPQGNSKVCNSRTGRNSNRKRKVAGWVGLLHNFFFLFKIFVPESWPCMAGLVFGWLIPLEGIWTMYDRFLHLQVAVIDVNKIINSTTSTASFYLCNLSLPLSNKQCHLRSSRILLEGSVVLLHTHHGIQPRTWYQANYRNL